jgi:hypothetical protein
MNTRLLDHDIRRTCRDLMAAGGRVTGRSLRRALRDRYGAAGKTERVFRIWRQETAIIAPPAQSPLPIDVAELQRRLVASEQAAAKQLARAELAELREQAHQDKWFMEIDRLRQEARAQPKYAAENRVLQEQVLRLRVELHAMKRLLASQLPEHGEMAGAAPEID